MKYLITKALDFGAGIYDAVYGKHYFEKYYKRLVELADLKGNENVLDVGCGPGNLDLMIAEVLDKGSVYGIDIGPKMIARAKKKAEKEGYKINYRTGNSTNLPYTDNRFDVVFTSFIYHHFSYEEKSQTLREIYRVLKPNGRYVSLEFTKFPHKFLLKFNNSGILHGLPSEIIKQSRFYVNKEVKGPSLARHHPAMYKILVKKSKK